MKIETTVMTCDGGKDGTPVDLTDQVQTFLARTGIVHGHIALFCNGTTTAITTMSPGAGEILRRALERLAPVEETFDHGDRWGRITGDALVKASLLKAGLTVPVMKGKLLLGERQRLVLVTFEHEPGPQTVIFQGIGDSLQVRDPSIDIG